MSNSTKGKQRHEEIYHDSMLAGAPVGKAWEEVSASFDRFCLTAGMEALGAMMEEDAEEACGPRHARVRSGAVIAGGARRARSASMAARSRSSGPGYAGSTGKKWRCRAGSRRSPRTGWAGGR